MRLSLENIHTKREAYKTLEKHMKAHQWDPLNGHLRRNTFRYYHADIEHLLLECEALIHERNRVELDNQEKDEKLEDFRVALDRAHTRLERLEAERRPLDIESGKAKPILLTKIVDALVALPDETSPATYRERMQDYALTVLAVLKREAVP